MFRIFETRSLSAPLFISLSIFGDKTLPTEQRLFLITSQISPVSLIATQAQAGKVICVALAMRDKPWTNNTSCRNRPPTGDSRTPPSGSTIPNRVQRDRTNHDKPQLDQEHRITFQRICAANLYRWFLLGYFCQYFR